MGVFNLRPTAYTIMPLKTAVKALSLIILRNKKTQVCITITCFTNA